MLSLNVVKEYEVVQRVVQRLEKYELEDKFRHIMLYEFVNWAWQEERLLISYQMQNVLFVTNR